MENTDAPKIYYTPALYAVEYNLMLGKKLVVVTAPPGYGKSIGINNVMFNLASNPDRLKHAHGGKLPSTVICESLTPFRVTLSSTVRYLNALVKKRAFYYAMSGETSYGPPESQLDQRNPHVLLMTTGYAIERSQYHQLGRNKRAHYLYFIDEAHDTSRETVLAIRYAIWTAMNNDNVQVIFSSATMDPDSIIAKYDPFYINLDEHGQLDNRPPVPTYGDNSRVELVFSEGGDSRWHRGAVSAVCASISSLEHGDSVISVMCPSKDAINSIVSLLEKESTLANYRIYPLHSEMTREEMEIAINDAYERKILVNTNIIENAITIPRLDIVIDSCVRKIPYVDAEGVVELKEVMASKANITQSAGRTGRVGRRGKCILLISKEQYDSLPDVMDSDLTRAPLYYYIVKLVKRDIAIKDVLVDIPQESIARDIRILMNLGIVERIGEDIADTSTFIVRDSIIDCKLRLTEIGGIVSRLQLPLRSSIAIATAIVDKAPLEILYYMVLVCCYADSRGDLFYRPSRRPREAKDAFDSRVEELERMQRNFVSFDTLEFLLNVWALQYLDPHHLKTNGIYERKLYDLVVSVEQVLATVQTITGPIPRPTNYNTLTTQEFSREIRAKMRPYIERAFDSWRVSLADDASYVLHNSILTDTPHDHVVALSMKRSYRKYIIYKYIDFNEPRQDSTRPL